MKDDTIEMGTWVFYKGDYYEVINVNDDEIKIQELQLVKNKQVFTVKRSELVIMTESDKFEAVTDLEGYD